MDLYGTLLHLRKKYVNAPAVKILAQCEYALKLSEADGGIYDDRIEKALALLTEAEEREDSLPQSVCSQAQTLLNPLRERAKQQRVICVPHAHIDMNWMWGYAETVSITLDTFRTILRFMGEYPTLTFAQSQASCYQIVERYDPDMLREIKRLVREGRWEVSASTWVEADKNMSGSESLAMQNVCAKKYLGELFELPDDYFTLDFEPDTFGHSEQVPEILAAGGVKYYYHCRGSEGPLLCRWEAPSGRSVLVNREENWYIGPMEPKIFMYLPAFCKQYGVDCGLRLFGLGDHGGGPTRRDIEAFLDMAEWPVFPRMEFGLYRDYFQRLETFSDQLPVEKGERNFMFPGCYSSQTRIKAANRLGENRLIEAEALAAMAQLFDVPVEFDMESAWQKHLFNQFHDILPGSGIAETRECAMGNFQEVLAAANTTSARACRAVADQIDSSEWVAVENNANDHVRRFSMAESAGYGYPAFPGAAPQLQTGSGLSRVLTVFNPTAYFREEYVETTLWDWNGDIHTLEIKDASGQSVPFEFTTGLEYPDDTLTYWEHTYRKITFRACVEPFGYAAYHLFPGKACAPTKYPAEIPLVSRPAEYHMENDCITVDFDPISLAVTSLRDNNGTEFVPAGQPFGVFRYISEQDEDMSAWTIGRYKEVRPLLQSANVTGCALEKGKLRQFIRYELHFSESRLTVTVSLTKGLSRLDYLVECDWQERAKPGDTIPQLSFAIPVANVESRYRYEIPFGFLDRKAMDLDVPSLGVAAAIQEGSAGGIGLLCRTKYGFRANNGTLSVTLLRSSCYPDPYPEHGIYQFDLSVFVADDLSPSSLAGLTGRYQFPLSVLSGQPHSGCLPLHGSAYSLQAKHVRLTGVKPLSEEALLLRLNEVDGCGETVQLVFAKPIAEAWLTDLSGKPIGQTVPSLSSNTIEIAVHAKRIITVKVRFR